MRRASKTLATLLLCASMLIGCGNAKETTNEETNSAPAEQTTAAEETFTVNFLDTDGTTVLSTEEVKSGECATEYTPEKENQIFMGWFGTPSLTHAFDFTQPITGDTEIFAGFMEDVEDTRTYALVGNGKSPLLAASGWGKTINEEHYLTKSPDANVYTITVDLCEGDEFQFAIDTAWSNQRGGGYLETTEQDGTSYLSVSGGLTDNTQKANIKCQVSGNYTFTLTTYPGADVVESESYSSNPYDTITWTYNGEMQGEAVKLDVQYFIKGAIITGWSDLYDDQYGFTEENGIHTLVIELEEGDEFLFTTLVTDEAGNTNVGSEYVRYSNITDKTSLEYVDKTESYNIVAKQAGTYTFTYNPETTELTVGFEAK